MTIEIDIIGESYSTDDRPVIAISTASAINNNYRLSDDVNYMKPETVNKLADFVLPPRAGPQEAVDEVNIY
jgi:hypothetical protein